MSAQKLVVCLAVALVAVIATEVASAPNYDVYASSKDNIQSHNFSVGNRVPGDKEVVRDNMTVTGGWLQVKSVRKTYNTTEVWEKITLVEVFDQETNGNGAYVSLLAGGPGHNSVTLKFKSQRGHGINIIVVIYAI